MHSPHHTPEDNQGTLESPVAQNYSRTEHEAWKHVKHGLEGYLTRIGHLLNTGRSRKDLDGD